MKRILLILVGVVVLAAVAAGIAVSRLDPETLRSKVAELSRDATGKAVYMAAAPSLSLMPLGISVGQASWGYENGKPAAGGLSVEVKSAVVRVDLMPLLSGKVVVQEVRLDSPRVTLRPEKDAAATPQATDKSGEQAATAKKADTLPLELERLNIINGSLLLEPQAGQVLRVDALNAAIENLKKGTEATVKLDMGLACDNPSLKGNFSLSGHVRLASGPKGDTVTLRQTKLSFTPLAGLVPAGLGPIQVGVDGSYSLADGRAQLEALKLGLQGLAVEATGQVGVAQQTFAGSVKISAEPTLLARHLGISLPSLPGTGKVQMQSGVDVTPERVKLSKLTGDADGVSLAADLTLGLGAVPSVQGAVKIGHVNLDAGKPAATGAGKAAPAPAAASSKAGQAGQTGQAEKQKTTAKESATIYPRLALDLSVASLTASKIKVENIHATVSGNGGRTTEYAVNPLELRLATGGSLNTTARVSLPAMNCAVAGKVSGLAVGPLLQALNGSRPVDGTAEAEYSLTFGASSAAAVKSSLSGKGSLTAAGIDLNGVSVLPKGTPVQGGIPSHFEKLYVPFTAQRGIVTINGMTLAGKGLSADGKGVVRLPQDNMDMTANVNVLGTQIPVVVSGPFANLSYGVDPKWAARMAIKAGGALLEGGMKAGGGAKGAAGSAVEGAAKGAGGLIKGLMGR